MWPCWFFRIAYVTGWYCQWHSCNHSPHWANTGAFPTGSALLSPDLGIQCYGIPLVGALHPPFYHTATLVHYIPNQRETLFVEYTYLATLLLFHYLVPSWHDSFVCHTYQVFICFCNYHILLVCVGLCLNCFLIFLSRDLFCIGLERCR